MRSNIWGTTTFSDTSTQREVSAVVWVTFEDLSPRQNTNRMLHKTQSRSTFHVDYFQTPMPTSVCGWPGLLLVWRWPIPSGYRYDRGRFLHAGNGAELTPLFCLQLAHLPSLQRRPATDDSAPARVLSYRAYKLNSNAPMHFCLILALRLKI